MSVLSIIRKNLRSDFSNIIYIGLTLGFVIQLFAMDLVAKNFPKPISSGEITGFVQNFILGNIIVTDISQSYAAGLLSVFLLLSGAIAAGRLASERGENTLMRIYSLPVSKAKILTGFIISNCISISVMAAVLIGFCRFAMGIDWGQSYIGVALLTLSGVFLSTAMSFAFSAMFKSSRAASGILAVIIVVTTFFSAPFDPYRTGRIGFSGLLMRFTMNDWLHEGYVKLMAGQPLSSVISNILPILGLAVIMTGIAAFSNRRESFYE
jgi:ABC-2 type transport system permease protein